MQNRWDTNPESSLVKSRKRLHEWSVRRNGGSLQRAVPSRTGPQIRKTIETVFFSLVLSNFSAYATVYNSDGSAADVIAKHAVASKGDTITLPAGTFTWSIPVTISKAIKLQGAGSGRIIGDTKSSATVGTGSKTFTTTRSGLAITAGQTLRIAKVVHPPYGGGSESSSPAFHTYMEGTVTSYSGTTLLMNITGTGGSGTWRFWTISTPSATTVIQNYDNGSGGDPGGRPLITINQSQSGSFEISGIKFINSGSTFSATLGPITHADLGPKALIHDCWFQNDAPGGSAIVSRSNRGLVWNCSFDNRFFNTSSAISIWHPSGASSWSTNSTMGMADTNGATNFYIEDCDFHFFLNITDFGDNARAVVRHCILDNAGLNSHGADTGPYGMRHVEVYDNELIFDNFGENDGSVTLPMNWFFWIRGGTGVITDNILPAISSSSWGLKGNVMLSLMYIREPGGPYSCWTSYPGPHQIGQGYGPGAEFHHFTASNGDNADYYLYLEPLYVWNNSGSAGNGVSLNNVSDGCGHGQSMSSYIQAGRDYYIGIAKPGYVKYTYPHPLRGGSPPGAPGNLHVRQ